jgi:phosphatidylglycerophosphate synthase
MLAALALWPSPPLWWVIVLFLLFAAASAFYVVLTAHARGFVPIERSGRIIATINMFALGAAFAAQWVTGLLVALPGGDSLGSETGFRLAFGFLALMLMAAILVYRRAPERPASGLARDRNHGL